jgi:hypothetical protein
MVHAQVPDGVITAVDAVRFFCSGAGKPGDLVYCNLAQPKPRRSSYAGHTDAAAAAAVSHRLVQERSLVPAAQYSATDAAAELAAAAVADAEVGFYGDGYKPYDLRAVPQQEANKQQHWVVSYHGVTHMR